MARSNKNDAENKNNSNDEELLTFPNITNAHEHIAANDEFVTLRNGDGAKQTSQSHNLASADPGALAGALENNGMWHKISNTKDVNSIITNIHSIMCHDAQRCKKEAEALTVHHKLRLTTDSLIHITNRLNYLIKLTTRSPAWYWPSLKPEIAY